MTAEGKIRKGNESKNLYNIFLVPFAFCPPLIISLKDIQNRYKKIEFKKKILPTIIMRAISSFIQKFFLAYFWKTIWSGNLWLGYLIHIHLSSFFIRYLLDLNSTFFCSFNSTGNKSIFAKCINTAIALSLH